MWDEIGICQLKLLLDTYDYLIVFLQQEQIDLSKVVAPELWQAFSYLLGKSR